MGVLKTLWDFTTDKIFGTVRQTAAEAVTGATGNALGKTAYGMIEQTYDMNLLQNIKGNIIALDTTQDYYDQMQVIYDSSVCVAAYIILIWFLVIHFMDLASSMRLNHETIFSSLIRFFVAKFFIDNAVTILMTLDALAYQIFSKINVAAEGQGNISFPTIDMSSIGYLLEDDAGIVVPISIIMSGFIPWLITMVTKLTITFTIYSRLIEIFVRGSFVPLAIPSIIFDGAHGPGIEVFKKYFAVVLQGAVMLLISMGILLVFGTLMGDNEGNSFTYLQVAEGYSIQYCLIYITAAAMFARSGALAKDIIGTH